MQEIKNAMIDGEWIVCANCGHKLGRVVGDKPPVGLEIKCHSCKEINLVNKPRKKPIKRELKSFQYKTPHCKHCEFYKDFTGTCIKKLMYWGLGERAKAQGSRTCKSFEPLKEYANNYKELKKND